MAAGLSNCTRCSQPYYRTGNLSLCETCLRHETHLFESYYYRLQRSVKGLNIMQVARHTGLDVQKLSDAIDYRLGLGQVVHLNNWKPGRCYVCRSPHSHKECREPVCLHCMETFFRVFKDADTKSSTDTAVNPTPTASTSNSTPRTPASISGNAARRLWEAFERGQNKQPVKLIDVSECITANGDERSVFPQPIDTTVMDLEIAELKAQLAETELELTRLKHQLHHYRQQFGELNAPVLRVVDEHQSSNQHLDPTLQEVLNQPDEHAEMTEAEWAAMEAELALDRPVLNRRVGEWAKGFKR